MLLQLCEGGIFFFRESCFRQSGDRARKANPTHYRNPREYFRWGASWQAQDVTTVQEQLRTAAIDVQGHAMSAHRLSVVFMWVSYLLLGWCIAQFESYVGFRV